MSQWFTSMQALCRTDVHEIVSISPHNLVYSILIWPRRVSRNMHNCLRKLAVAISLLHWMLLIIPRNGWKSSIRNFTIYPPYIIHCDRKCSPEFFAHSHPFRVLLFLSTQQKKYITISITPFPICKTDTHITFRSHFVVVSQQLPRFWTTERNLCGQNDEVIRKQKTVSTSNLCVRVYATTTCTSYNLYSLNCNQHFICCVKYYSSRLEIVC